jgi:hypothetical protein
MRHAQAEHHSSGLLHVTADLTLDTEGAALDIADLLEHLPHALSGVTTRLELADSTETICLAVRRTTVRLAQGESR